ncbi:hypothetical protein [Hydrogenophaga sp.]|uniref:hypothetical protein n=1 Tax=Hydrogenophaga sp. TaxID=1904254 RepID=UPI0027374E4B|nr:hypothetical protein [Hydrogenophaga sp.]MDP3323237.1 hypothetical protein [Hydrogenophaga sp.]MDP3888273.1 hypothetical protein [Hydrogenophaga sp.]
MGTPEWLKRTSDVLSMHSESHAPFVLQVHLCDSIAPYLVEKSRDGIQPEFHAFLCTTLAVLSMPPL